MNQKRKLIFIGIITIIALALIIIIGPCDKFTHGYFGEEIDIGQIAVEDMGETINLADENYTMSFVPLKDHMAGVEIYLVNQPKGNTGKLELTFMDDDGKVLDTVEVDLAKVKAASWYKVRTNAKFKKGNTYLLTFSTNGECLNIPYLQTVDPDYLPNETIEGNILLCYAYEQSTFTFQNRILISLFIVAIWIFLMSLFVSDNKKVWLKYVSCFLFMTLILSWNYMYNSMDNQNTSFSKFQNDSETLVTGPIYAEEDGEYFRTNAEKGYGLGRYFNLKGMLRDYESSYISDDNWLNGYSRNEAAIVVNSNSYSKEVAIAGNQIKLENGEVYQITSIDDNGTNIIIYLNSDKVLSYAKYGSLDNAIFLDAGGNELHKSLISSYRSQYGLQGKVFRHLARYMDDGEKITTLNLICCLASAVVFTLITFLISMKYNNLMALCFFFTFWLSPWIVNFARNLYWVEFTWFLPMAVGLFCAWKIDSRKCRIISYVATFAAIVGKCLCGYEYITVVMMGLISFLLADLINALVKKDNKKAKLIFRTTVIIGGIAIAGFMVAICIHALLKGDGSIMDGIKNIIKQDVLRRTYGADINSRNPADGREGYSIFASTWEVYCLYFHFNTEVITGITGNLFALVCIVPLLIFGYEFKIKKVDYQLLAMYLVFFVTSISWFILAKAHSYVHIHMNYVLWYFGFVQICFYIIINKIVVLIKGQKEIIKGNKNE